MYIHLFTRSPNYFLTPASILYYYHFPPVHVFHILSLVVHPFTSTHPIYTFIFIASIHIQQSQFLQFVFKAVPSSHLFSHYYVLLSPFVLHQNLCKVVLSQATMKMWYITLATRTLENAFMNSPTHPSTHACTHSNAL
jgi:hypothetical protein